MPRFAPHARPRTDAVASYPLIAAQPGIWMAEELSQGEGFAVAHCTAIEGDLDEDLFLRALRQGLFEAETLHVRFAMTDAGPCQQVVRPEAPEDLAAIHLVDCTHEAAPEAAARHAMNADLARDLRLADAAPLYHHTLFRLGAGRWLWYQRYHHIAVDGYSIGQIARRIGAIHASLVRGEDICPAQVAPLGEVVAEYEARAQSPAHARDREFWSAYTRDRAAPASLAGTIEAASRDLPNHSVLRREVPLAPALTARFAEIGRAAQLGPSEAVTAAILAYLQRMTQARELALGMPFMRRLGSAAALSSVPVVNVLPLYVQADGRSTLASLCTTLAGELRQVRRHQRYAGEQVLRESGALEQGRALFGPVVNLKLYARELTLPGARTRTQVLASGPVADIEFDVGFENDTLVLGLLANPARYDAATLARHAERLAAFLAALAEAPARAIGEVELLTPREAETISTWSKGPEIALPANEQSVLDVLADNTARSPHALALEDAARQLDFAELQGEAARLSRLLCARGIGAGDVVASALPRSAEALAALVGVLGTGAAWMPLDPGYPAERLKVMCADARPALILARTADATTSGELGPPVLALDDPAVRAELSRLSPSPLTDAERRAPLTRESLAYVLYTSGSTGTPKGVMIPHASLLNLLHAHRTGLYGETIRRAGGRQIRALHTTAFAFDAAWDQIIWMFLGHALFVCDEDERRDPEAIVARARSWCADTLAPTPLVLEQLLACGLLEGTQRPRLLAIGGEPVPPALWQRLRAEPGLLAQNHYGPVECTVDATGITFDQAPEPVIGRPLANTRIHILDDQLRPVPIGVTGELYIAGAGLGLGYLGDARRTASRFLANPFAPGQRLDRTGDLARWQEGGLIDFVGRRDRQVKIRGMRVEPADIEHALAALPGVESAVVLAEPFAGTYRLLAWASGAGTPDTWLAALAERLPSYMLPASIAAVSEWPFTAHGKVDRTRLPRPEISAHEGNLRACASREEEVLCQAIAETLGLPSVGPEADFFRLGGDSIQAMTLSTRLRKAGYRLPPREIFTLRRPDRMAPALAPLERSPARIGRGEGRVGALPIVARFAAEQGWKRSFVQGVAVRVPAGLTHAMLERAFEALVRAHPALRARVEECVGDEGLYLSPRASFDVARLVELSARSANMAAMDPHLDAAFAQVCAALYPSTCDMLRARFWPGDETPDGAPGWLMIAAHHLIVDGVSWRVILKDLASAAEAVLAGALPYLAPEETSLADWADELARQVPERRAEAPLWRAALAAPLRRLTRTVNAPLEQVAASGSLRLLLDPARTAALLHDLPEGFRATTQEVLLAALGRAWSGVGRVAALRVAMEAHGRHDSDRADPSRTVGWLTAIYPVLLDTIAQDERAAIRCAKQALRGVPDQGLGFGILRHLDPETGPTLERLEAAQGPEILFNYLGRFASGETCWTPQPLSGAFADSFAVARDPAMRLSYPVEFNAFVEEGAAPRLAIHWSWAPSRIDRATIEALHDALGAAIDSFVDGLAADPTAAGDTLVPAQVPGADAATLAEMRACHGPLAALLPLLPLQQGLLFHAQVDPAAQAYATMTRVTLEGTPDVERLQRALDQVLRAHPQLAARFDADASGASWQIVPADPGHWPLDVLRLDDLDEPDRAAALAAIERGELARDFTPARGPLVHAALVWLAPERHVLLLNAHHLVVDGWSTPLLLEALLTAYREDAALTAPAIGYDDIVLQLAAREQAPAREAWAQALEGARPLRAFPQDTEATSRVREFERRLTPALEEALRARGREQGVTLNTLLQTAFAALLSLETGRQDILFGAPVSGRTSPVEGIESHIGLFSNTLPVRIRLRPEVPLAAQLGEVQAQQAALLEHDGLPLAELQAMVGGRAGGEALFDTLFVAEGAPAGGDLFARDHAGLRLAQVRNRGFTHYPLTLLMLPGDALQLVLEVRDSVEDPERLLDRLLALLEHLAHDSETPWAAYDPLLAHERARIDATNATHHPLPATTLATCLAQQCARTPGELALCDEEHTLTYAQLREQTRALAARLVAAGVRRGDLVAVALPRSVRLTIALHAVIEAGAAYLPLDLAYPDARLALMLEDARPGLILSDSLHAARLESWGEVLRFDALADPQHAAQTPPLPPEQAPRPEDPAYCIYTSGSTGRPKGVVVAHKAITNRLAWMQHAYRLEAGERVLQKTPCSFDVSVWEFFWPLMEGASLVMAPPEAHRDPEAIAQLIARHRITTLHFVPSMLSAFLDWIAADAPRRQPLVASLTRVFVSGEALSSALARSFASLLPGALHNLYGPTEAAVDVTHHTVTGDEDGAGVPIGVPVWNTTLRILDPLLRPCPPGVAGELYLSGVQLAEGYHGRAALTATRFVADPQDNGARMYRTGDIARWRETHGAGCTVEYLGRADDQLKIRGQRIELGEIEAALAALPGVAGAAAQAMVLGNAAPQGTGDARQLVGYLVAAPGAAPLDPEALRAILLERLPAHMVPVVLVRLDALPLSPNGKLDRKALPRPDSTQAQGRPPRPGLESRIASAFARLLDRPVIGAQDDFFALGGHSLLAMQLAAELRAATGLPVSVGQIMVAPSVAALAEVIGREDAGEEGQGAGFSAVLHLRAGVASPLFCIHPASGFAWQYSGLLRYLPQDLPVIGLQSPRPDGVIAASADLAEAAQGHLAQIRRIQPHGPYHLLGYSLGGTLAHAIAAQLRAEGEDVAFLGLLDTYPPEGQDWTPPTSEESEAEVARERGQFLAAMGEAEPRAQDLRQEPEGACEPERGAMFETIVANYADAVRLLAQGGTPHLPGSALLYVARLSLPEGWKPREEWAPYLDDLETVELDCAHTDILSPGTLATLGPRLADRLNELRRVQVPGQPQAPERYPTAD